MATAVAAVAVAVKKEKKLPPLNSPSLLISLSPHFLTLSLTVAPVAVVTESLFPGKPLTQRRARPDANLLLV